MITNAWFDFDIRNDPVFQDTIKPFILEQLALLKAYDEQRLKKDSTITYIFHEHAERAAQEARKVAALMGQPENVQEAMYWSVLAHDIGKHQLPLTVWDLPGKPDPETKALSRTHTDLGCQIVERELIAVRLGGERHPFAELMLDIIGNHHKLPSDDLSMPARTMIIIEDFDGRSRRRPGKIWEDRDLSAPSVLDRMRTEPDKGAKLYDMEIFDFFDKLKREEFEAAATAPSPSDASNTRKGLQ